MQILSSPPPTASKMDEYLLKIAHTYSVKWVPEPRREELYVFVSLLSQSLGADLHDV